MKMKPVYVCVCVCVMHFPQARQRKLRVAPGDYRYGKITRTLHRDFVVVRRHLDVDKPNRSFAFGGRHGWEHVSHGFLECSLTIFHRASHRSFSMGKKKKSI